ncbi:cyclic nucleotide-binding domain-containing protein [Marinobacterium sp. D7]|uniref:cyclic nucleotide-binding domain-containing protein n=1 Tax=Marinobacterium ramblicola TaxID=2849041 RepID=UPI001C2CD7B2|nr:cyclic nucleotide-binding domain-containing protein [Marinobacterium ramblicola]MBV1788212.1 cyclic nucleotide-binding domain-containing protein [Marinobacterium ramblicola]
MKVIDAREYWQAQGTAYFQELSAFGALPERVVHRLLLDGRLISLAAGETLYTSGDPAASFFIVLQGVINNYMPRKDGGRVFARRHEPGDDMSFIPMIALCDRPSIAIAEEASVVVEISSDQFLVLHQQEPDAFGLMLINLVRGTARAFLVLARMLADLDVDQNLAFAPQGDARGTSDFPL